MAKRGLRGYYGVYGPLHFAKVAGSYAVVTPLRKAASYEPCTPRIAILGIWGDTVSTWQYVVVTGST